MGVGPDKYEHVNVVYLGAPSPVEALAMAARWAQENDGGYIIEALTWHDVAHKPDEVRYQIGIYYEPQ
jgi:hypothetical protein